MTATSGEHPVHPLGPHARVLLTSVFGPYAQDDSFGSRLINPMELYHNQVTRVQKAFSLRSFNRSWGLMMIQVNIDAPCTLLDFPTQERFIEEIKTREYDVIGITSIMTNLLKVRRMCREIRKYQPNAKIVVGGHITGVADLERWADMDYVARGDGVRWMRNFLGENENQPVRHPQVFGSFGARIMGVNLHDLPGELSATLIPSVGCPLGCNFCSTSAMFGGKGKSVPFYRSAQDLFHIMSDLASNMHVKAFFVMDENFLLDKKRALELLDLMEEHNKPWALYVFSSANILRQYTMEQLVALGVSWVWLGLEGENSQYKKLAGCDSIELVRDLRSNGIRVLGSSIIGLENHTPENIDAAIDRMVRHKTDFHQIMLYTPIPGTPLHAEFTAESRMLSNVEMSFPDTHGQLLFNYHHPHIKDNQEGELLLRAFERDFQENGPSVARIIRTTLRGWKRHKNHPNPRVRARFAYEAANLPVQYAGALWAAKHYFRDDPHRKQLIAELLDELYDEFGQESRRAAPILGRRIYRKLIQEEQRLDNGWTYEPPTSYETNQADGPDGATFVEGLSTDK